MDYFLGYIDVRNPWGASFAVKYPLMSMWIETITSHDDTYYNPSAFPCNITSPIPEEKAVYQMVFIWDQNLPIVFCKSRLWTKMRGTWAVGLNWIASYIHSHEALCKHLLSASYTLWPPYRNVKVIAFGKAVLGMVTALEQILGDHITEGVASIPVGSLETAKKLFPHHMPQENSKIRWYVHSGPV